MGRVWDKRELSHNKLLEQRKLAFLNLIYLYRTSNEHNLFRTMDPAEAARLVVDPPAPFLVVECDRAAVGSRRYPTLYDSLLSVADDRCAVVEESILTGEAAAAVLQPIHLRLRLVEVAATSVVSDEDGDEPWR